MSHIDDSPCCGTCGKYLVYLLMALGCVTAFIAAICMFVGGGQLYAVDYFDSVTDRSSTPNISPTVLSDLGNVVSCKSILKAIWDNDTAVADPFIDPATDKLVSDYAKAYAVAFCIGNQMSVGPVYFICMTGFITFVTAIMAFIYFWTKGEYAYYWVYALASISLGLILSGFMILGANTSEEVYNMLPCSDGAMDQSTYTELLTQGAAFSCVFGRDRTDLVDLGSNPVVFNPDYNLPGQSYFLTQVGTVYAGLALGLVSVLVFIGLFAAIPPKPEWKTSPPPSS